MPVMLQITHVDRDTSQHPARYQVVFQAGDSHYLYDSGNLAQGKESTLARANYAAGTWEPFATLGGAETLTETVIRLRGGLGLPFAAFRAAYEFWEEGHRVGYAQGQADLIRADQIQMEF
jgi:hypothetical protein